MIEEQCSQYQKRKNRRSNEFSFQVKRIYFIHKDIEIQYLLQTLCRQSSEEGLKRTKLLYEYEPVPTIISVTREKENLPPNAIFETTVLKLRKSHQDKRFDIT